MICFSRVHRVNKPICLDSCRVVSEEDKAAKQFHCREQHKRVTIDDEDSPWEVYVNKRRLWIKRKREVRGSSTAKPHEYKAWVVREEVLRFWFARATIARVFWKRDIGMCHYCRLLFLLTKASRLSRRMVLRLIARTVGNKTLCVGLNMGRTTVWWSIWRVSNLFVLWRTPRMPTDLLVDHWWDVVSVTSSVSLKSVFERKKCNVDEGHFKS